MAHVSSQAHRILLTRDPGLLKRSVVTHGYWIRESDPQRQAREILERFDLFGAIVPFTRCLCCNALLQPVRKEMVRDRLPPMTREVHAKFHICPECDRVYWKGSHYRRMMQLIEGLQSHE